MLIALSPGAGTVVGVDLGHRHLRVALADRTGTVLAEETETIDVDEDGAVALDRAAAAARRIAGAAGHTRSSVHMVGMCVPAPQCEPVLCELFCENGFATDENGCEICSCNEPVDTCGPIINDYETELAEIMACETDDQCGQVLTGTSCGCTRNLVARVDADLADLEEVRAKAELNECSLGGISTCDCPPADGFVCNDGTCGWNYTNG